MSDKVCTMSFFAYIALCGPQPAERSALHGVLAQQGYSYREAALAQEFGAAALYGARLTCAAPYELELTGPPDLESALLDPLEQDGRWRHYQECARQLGRTVADFHAAPDIDALYQATPIDLGVVTLMRALAAAVACRPLIVNLDPDFEMHLGHGAEICGIAAICQVAWQSCAFSDLASPLRLVIE